MNTVTLNVFEKKCNYSASILLRIILVIAIIGFAESLNAQVNKEYKSYRQGFYHGLRYGLFEPIHYDSKKSYPLIIYLHGSTDTLSRALSWYQDDVQKENPCFVLSPKTTEANQGWGNTWVNKHTPAMEKTLSLMDSLTHKYNIDKNRLYIYGISMGGFGTFSVLAKEPGKFAGAYAVCGGSNVDVAPLITTPLWIFHGSEDDVVPVRLSKNMYSEMIKKGNTTVRYTEYPGVKHNSWENVAQEKTLAKWLLSQEKGRTSDIPDQVSGVNVSKLFNSTARLQWNKTQQSASKDKEVWHYKIFRDNELIAEVAGDVVEFNDYKYDNKSEHHYHVVSVNYFFKESKPSVQVRLE
jgi:poly(3-hydroxybutyrate) depolymerase